MTFGRCCAVADQANLRRGTEGLNFSDQDVMEITNFLEIRHFPQDAIHRRYIYGKSHAVSFCS
jgi:hypothetical protein